MATRAILEPFDSPKQDHIMEDPGSRLRSIREKLKLTMREVEKASQIISDRLRSPEYKLFLGGLNQIETHNVVPSVYRIYTLCAIYRLDYGEVLKWYGVDLARLPADAMAVQLPATHLMQIDSNAGEIVAPLGLDPGIDLTKTTFLSRAISKWGKIPLVLLNTLELKKFRYALIGSDDWNMYPLIQPGALVTIDDTRRKIINSGWNNEFERPIYFFEHRNGYACCWCTLNDDTLVLTPHPGSQCMPQVFSYQRDIDVVGQVTGVAMLLDLERRRNTRS
jgi:transcriptional regulator with XRE-family HTH domain